MKVVLDFMGNRRVRAFLACSVLMLIWPSAQGAFCSLRNPVAVIQSLYPEADHHRSLVKTIDRDIRDSISKRLPFTLHFNELGRHTLYVAQRQDTPLGLVHARSEVTEWGLVEVAWAISTNLKIEGFYFQRCRSSACTEDLRQQLSDELSGKSLDQILLLLTPDGKALTAELATKFQQNQSIVLSTIRSGLKTLAATEYGWYDDIAELRRRSMAIGWLDKEQGIKLLPVENSELDAIQVPEAIAPVYTFVEQSSIKAFRVMADEAEVARLVDATWRYNGQSGNFSWLFSQAGEILAIEYLHPLPDQNTELSFNQLLGQDVVSVKNCAGAAQMASSTLFMSAYKRIEIIPDED